MSPINPSDAPEVALEFMNRDHQETVKLTNALYRSIEQGVVAREPESAITVDLRKPVNHIREHFAR